MSESPKHPFDRIDEQKPTDATTPSLEAQHGSTQSVEETGEKPVPDRRTQRILIGSQRDAAARVTKKKRDWYVPGQKEEPVDNEPAVDVEGPAADEPTISIDNPAAAETPAAASKKNAAAVEEPVSVVDQPAAAKPERHFPPPNTRGQLPPDLEEELADALADVSIDDLISGSDSISDKPLLDPESRHVGRVVAVERDNVFVELGAREQGVVPLKIFDEPPQPGEELKVIVTRFNLDDGLYDLLVPNASADVSDWTDLAEGMLVEAVVTGHNSGGLECEVNKIRGFIPVSQVSLYRVENLEEFVGERFICLVSEADPQRRNLVLSRRAVLEKEKEDARRELLASLAPGQIHEGVVRKLMDFGAFVDLGGVDGLIHISQLSWGRVGHPGEVLSEGQTVKVKILKMDEAGNRISLGYRDMIESPWSGVENKYPVGSTAKGKVSKLMEFGAFVELEPGVEGLVHISELSHKRVHRCSDVVSEDQAVDVVIKSVDAKAQRIGLSIKDALPPLEPETDKDDEQPAEPAVQRALKRPVKELKGGLDRSADGERFGLNW